MQSVIGCTHYVCGEGEQAYMRQRETPEITFVPREEIDRPDEAYTELQSLMQLPDAALRIAIACRRSRGEGRSRSVPGHRSLARRSECANEVRIAARKKLQAPPWSFT